MEADKQTWRASEGAQSIVVGQGVYAEVISRPDYQQILNVIARMRQFLFEGEQRALSSNGGRLRFADLT